MNMTQGVTHLPDGKVKLEPEFFDGVAKNTFRKPMILYLGIFCIGFFVWGLSSRNILIVGAAGVAIVGLYLWWKH
jgi:hypothetical protein